MGLLLAGVWSDERAPRTDDRGRFRRAESAFRDWVSADGSSGFQAEPGRYHLYVNLGCPWAFRTVLYRRLKGLEAVISMSVTAPAMGPQGWEFRDEPGCVPDPIHGAKHLHEVYTAAKPDYSGRVTVPVLWDRERGTIVNNESSELIRMLNREFDAFGRAELDFYPEELRAEIDATNDFVYRNLNNGVYRAGFASTQEAYEEAAEDVFAALDALEERLSRQRYLTGGRITEVDWRLFATLVRFDAAYYARFKCNRRRLVDYPELWAYTRELYQYPGVAECVDLDHIKKIYFGGATQGDPRRLIPIGPEIDFAAAHDRERLPAD